MGQLHLLFLPLMAHGHMMPILDMAKLFISRGQKATIISTPAFSESIRKVQDLGIDISLRMIKFPPEESRLPNHVVSFDQATSDDLVPKFIRALYLLQEPVEKLMQELQPDCLISDMFFPWTVDSAAKFGIPRLIFHGTSYFALCASEQMKRHKPFMNVSSDFEPFVVPYLPHEVKLVRTQVSEFDLEDKDDDFTKLSHHVRVSDDRSYGVVVNSFYELEPDYADHYRHVLGRKAWNIGPLLLYCDVNETKEVTGKKSTIDAHECLSWLDSKGPNSVVYVCFGSMANFTASQLHEIGMGLDYLGQDFVWVVRKNEDENESEEWMPKDFVERTKGRGLVIRGWAPQVAILGHRAIGVFVTHCGWNSTLEGICSGVPMVTWPVFAEQFLNEKLVTEILRIGVPVGSKKWKLVASEGVSREMVVDAVKSVMVGDFAMKIRSRAKFYKEMASKAIEDGGSSHSSLNALVDDLKVKSSRTKEKGLNKVVK